MKEVVLVVGALMEMRCGLEQRTILQIVLQPLESLLVLPDYAVQNGDSKKMGLAHWQKIILYGIVRGILR